MRADRERLYDAVFLLCLVLASLFVRGAFLGFESKDMTDYLSPWYDAIKEQGAFKALASDFSNYTPPYIYLLILAAQLPIEKLLAIKLISLIFDYIAAAFVFSLLKRRYAKGPAALVGSAAFLLCPTVVLNGACWGQCDVVFTCFILASMYFLFQGKGTRALVLYGIAFSLKLQALFVLPFYLVFFFQRRIRLWQLALIPATYLALCLPALIAGRPILELLGVYWEQTKAYDQLTMNAPSIYQWLPKKLDYEAIRLAGIAVSGFAFVFIVYACLKLRLPKNEGQAIKIAAISAIALPFLLPNMHERYFFVADCLTILVALYYPRLAYIPILVVSASFFCYLPYLFNNPGPIGQGLLSISMCIALFFLTRDIWRERNQGEAG